MPSLLDGLFFWRKRSRERFEEALAAVENGAGTVQDVGILAEATQWDEESKAKAESALIQLLPLLRRWSLFGHPHTQRFALYRYLRLDTPNPELTEALLESLENSTASSALDYIEELSRAAADSPSQKRIVQIAKARLPVLRDRILMNQGEHTLLRPSAAPPKPPEDTTLLLHPSFPPAVPSSTMRSKPGEE